MTQRLHILLEDDEIAEIRRIAERQGTTVAAWMREALRAACQEAVSADSRRKLSAVSMPALMRSRGWSASGASAGYAVFVARAPSAARRPTYSISPTGPNMNVRNMHGTTSRCLMPRSAASITIQQPMKKSKAR